MKTLLFFALFFSGISFAQTNVIAAKSHSNFDYSGPSDPDNFGEHILPRTIQSVNYLGGDCIVEIHSTPLAEQGKEFDTICDHPFLQVGQVDVQRIKSMYPEDTKFIGFNALKSDQKAVKKRLRKEKRKSKKSSGLIILLIGGGLFLIYLLSPNHKKVRT